MTGLQNSSIFRYRDDEYLIIADDGLCGEGGLVFLEVLPQGFDGEAVGDIKGEAVAYGVAAVFVVAGKFPGGYFVPFRREIGWTAGCIGQDRDACPFFAAEGIGDGG